MSASLKTAFKTAKGTLKWAAPLASLETFPASSCTWELLFVPLNPLGAAQSRHRIRLRLNRPGHPSTLMSVGTIWYEHHVATAGGETLSGWWTQVTLTDASSYKGDTAVEWIKQLKAAFMSLCAPPGLEAPAAGHQAAPPTASLPSLRDEL